MIQRLLSGEEKTKWRISISPFIVSLVEHETMEPTHHVLFMIDSKFVILLRCMFYKKYNVTRDHFYLATPTIATNQ